MALTPLEIHNKEFARGFRGYSEDEVNDFLNQVIKDYETFIQQRKILENKNEELQQKLDKFSGIKDSLNKSIIIAQEAADTLKRNAQSEATLIIREAEKNADRVVSEALDKTNKITLEHENLKSQVALYRSKFKMLVESQLKMITEDHWDGLQNAILGANEVESVQQEASATRAIQESEREADIERLLFPKAGLHEAQEAEMITEQPKTVEVNADDFKIDDQFLQDLAAYNAEEVQHEDLVEPTVLDSREQAMRERDEKLSNFVASLKETEADNPVSQVASEPVKVEAPIEPTKESPAPKAKVRFRTNRSFNK